MKKLLLLFCLISFTRTEAQVVFCPSGAEWHCNFGLSNSRVVNEMIKYMRDTIIGQDTLKLLFSTRIYYDCNPGLPPFYTLIKQRGDTVFFNNMSTNATWQILYNFAAQAGQGWQITYFKYNNIFTKNYVVDSISTVTINGIPLRRLHIGAYYVTERLGWSEFLFPFRGFDVCLTGQFAWNLCYQDSAFGLLKYKSYACDAEGTVGINALPLHKMIKTFPNPATTMLTISVEDQSNGAQIYVVDLLGEKIMTAEVKHEKQEIDLSALKQGVYFLQVFDQGKLIANEKLIKE